MNRRTFLSALSALPLVGPPFTSMTACAAAETTPKLTLEPAKWSGTSLTIIGGIRFWHDIGRTVTANYGDRVAAIEAADGIIEFGAGTPPVLLRSGVLWWAE